MVLSCTHTEIELAASVAIAVFSFFLWRVNQRVKSLHEESVVRNDAILNIQGLQLVDAENLGQAGFRFRMWNSGLKPTQILDAYLVNNNSTGARRIRLHFQRIQSGRPYVEGETLSSQYAKFPEDPEPTPLRGEFLQSGEAWTLEAFGEHERGLRTYSDPRLRIEPVLGDPIEYPILDGWSWSVVTNRRDLHRRVQTDKKNRSDPTVAVPG